MNRMMRGGWCGVISAAALALLASCNHSKSLKTLEAQSKRLDPPQAVRRPARESLRDFGKMVTAYTGARGTTLIELDIMPNDSGIQKELPQDLSVYAQNVIADMGGNLRTTNAIPAYALISTAYASGLNSHDHRKGPPPALRLRGRLLGFHEQVAKSREIRADVLAAIGSGKGDGQAAMDDRRTLTSLRISLQLADADGVNLPGPAAVYELFLLKDEQGASLGVYFDGTGVGMGSKVQVAQNARDAMYDACAACVMQLMGHAFLIPYYRSSSVFVPDPDLEARYRSYLMRSTTRDLDLTAKRLLFSSGSPMDAGDAEMTPNDAALLAAQFQRAGVDAGNHRSKVDFIMELWRTLDYAAGAARMETFEDDAERAAREKAALAPAATGQIEGSAGSSALPDPATEWGFPAGTPVVVLDFRRVLSSRERQVLIDVLASNPRCGEVHGDSKNEGLYGAHFDGAAGDLQSAWRAHPDLPPMDYIWVGNDFAKLVVVPK